MKLDVDSKIERLWQWNTQRPIIGIWQKDNEELAAIVGPMLQQPIQIAQLGVKYEMQWHVEEDIGVWGQKRLVMG